MVRKKSRIYLIKIRKIKRMVRKVERKWCEVLKNIFIYNIMIWEEI